MSKLSIFYSTQTVNTWIPNLNFSNKRGGCKVSRVSGVDFKNYEHWNYWNFFFPIIFVQTFGEKSIVEVKKWSSTENVFIITLKIGF